MAKKKNTIELTLTEFLSMYGLQDEMIVSNYYDLKIDRDRRIYMFYADCYIAEGFTPKLRIVANRIKGTIYVEFVGLEQKYLYLLRSKYNNIKPYLTQLFNDWLYDVQDILFKIRTV